MQGSYLILGAIALAALAALRHRLPWLGTVSRVVDGDSLEAIHFGRVQQIRLCGIDAPEWRQPYGREAQHQLATLIEHRVVLFIPGGKDRYDRRVCHVIIGWRCASCWMAYNGHAWGLRALPSFLTLIPRIRRKGLWAGQRPVEPRIWRLSSKRFPSR